MKARRLTWVRNLLFFLDIYDVTLQIALSVIVGWIAAGLLTRVGIPPVGPELLSGSRPLETLGTVTVCLPASLHASVLRDHASWLSATSPKPQAVLRLAWIAAVFASAIIMALIWIATLPEEISKSHVAYYWLLIQSLAILSTMLGYGLAIFIPILFVSFFSLGSVVPYKWNIVYNVAADTELRFIAGAVFVYTLSWYCCQVRASS